MYFFSSIQKKIVTLFRVNLGWLIKFVFKSLGIYWSYLISLFIGRGTWSVFVDGLEIKLGFNNSYQHHMAQILAKKKHEFRLLELWKDVCEKPRIVVDVGGYNGIFGLVSALANPKSIVYIFEPDVDCFKQIEDNIKLNGLKNVVVVPAAVWDQTGQVFFTAKAETGGRIVSSGVSTLAYKLDDYFKDKKPPNLIKIDIEGAELRALSGLQEILTLGQVEVLVEVHLSYLDLFGDSVEDFKKFVEKIGYKKLRLGEISGISEHYWLYR